MTVKTLLIITSDPDLAISHHAYRFAKAFLELQSAIIESEPYNSESSKGFKNTLSLFFYADAAHLANSLRWVSADRDNLTALWSELSKKHNVRLPVCVSTALTRGITDRDNAQRHQLKSHNVAEGFQLVGLGELAEQLALADKVISF